MPVPGNPYGNPNPYAYNPSAWTGPGPAPANWGTRANWNTAPHFFESLMPGGHAGMTPIGGGAWTGWTEEGWANSAARARGDAPPSAFVPSPMTQGTTTPATPPTSQDAIENAFANPGSIQHGNIPVFGPPPTGTTPGISPLTAPGITSPATTPTTTPSPNANQINLGDLSSFFQNFLQQGQQQPQGGLDLSGLGQYRSQLPYYSPG